jgi:hypothetical protein
MFTDIVRYKWFAWLIIMGSGFDDWIYWHFFTITINCNSSHSQLLLNVCLTNLSEESQTNISLISDGFESKSGSKVTLRLVVYRQSLRLAIKPFETHAMDLFLSTESLRPRTVNSSSVILCVIRCRETCVNHVATLSYSLLQSISCLPTCYLATTRSLLFVVAGTWLPSRCSAMDFCSSSTIPAFSRHVTVSCSVTLSIWGNFFFWNVWATFMEMCPLACLTCSSALIIEDIRSSETSMNFYGTIEALPSQ